jgi:hypothetical protein
VDEVGDQGKRVLVRHCPLVQVSVVLNWLKFAILFLYKEKAAGVRRLGSANLLLSRFQGTVARSEHKCYLFRTSTKRLFARRREDSQGERKDVLGLGTKLRLRSQRYTTTGLNTSAPRGLAPPSSYSSWPVMTSQDVISCGPTRTQVTTQRVPYKHSAYRTNKAR